MNHDRITELYNGEIGPPDSQRRARTRIHWLCSRADGERVLDIGCSQGIASMLLAREGRHVTGIDVEHAALEYARAQLEREEPHVAERVSFQFAEAGRLPFEDASFDTVLLGEVLEHQLQPDAIVGEARRVLKDGGALVITFPYGIFRYPDHKEPLYLEPVLRLLENDYSVELIELVERWVGIVARAARPGSETATARTWARGLEIAEARLADADATLEQRWESLKNTQSRLTETEQRLAAAEGRLAFPEEQAEGAGESPREAAMLRQRLRETRDELELAQERIAFISSEREALEQALLAADARAASLAGELATAEVELEDARERLRSDRLDPDGSPGAVGADALRDGRHEAAAAAFRLAAERDPGVAGNWLGLGRALRGLKRLRTPRRRSSAPSSCIRDCAMRNGNRCGSSPDSIGRPASRSSRRVSARLSDFGRMSSSGLRRSPSAPERTSSRSRSASACWPPSRSARPGSRRRRAPIGSSATRAGRPRSSIVGSRRAIRGRSAPRLASCAIPTTWSGSRTAGALDPPEVALLVEFAQVFLRRGQPVIARDLIDRAATLAPGVRWWTTCAGARRTTSASTTAAGSGLIPAAGSSGSPDGYCTSSAPRFRTTRAGARTGPITSLVPSASGTRPEVVTLLGFPWGDGVVGAVRPMCSTGSSTSGSRMRIRRTRRSPNGWAATSTGWFHSWRPCGRRCCTRLPTTSTRCWRSSCASCSASPSSTRCADFPRSGRFAAEGHGRAATRASGAARWSSSACTPPTGS